MSPIRHGGPLALAGLVLLAAGGVGRAQPPGGAPDLFAKPVFPGRSPGDGNGDVFARPLFADNPGSTTGPARNERALFELARSYLDEKSYQSAADTLRDFLKYHPRSRQAAEATYRLALTHLLQGRAEEARKLHEQLVNDYPSSPWARLVLQVHADEGQLRKFINEHRRRADGPGGPAEAHAAIELLELYRARFPNGKLMSLAEILYKMAVCARLAGDGDSFRRGMEALQKAAKDGDWAKLAAYWLADDRAFAEGLEEVADLHAEGDGPLAFLALAEQYEPMLSASRRLTCRCLRARCLHRLGRDAEAEAAWRAVLAEHPDAAEAPACRLALADHYYSRKDVARAVVEFQALVARHPDSPEAALARRRLPALENHDASWAEVERVLAGWARQLQEAHGGLAFAVSLQTPDPALRVRCRVAFQDRDHCLLSLRVRGRGFLMANNDQGGWFHNTAEDFAVHTRQKIDLPMPSLEITEDPATGMHTCKLGLSSGQTTPSVTIPARWAADTVSRLQSCCYLTRQARTVGGEERIVLRLESLGGEVCETDVCEVEVDARQQMLRAVRCTLPARNGERIVLTLSDVVAREKLPAEAFEVKLPAALSVRETEKANPLEWLGQMFRLGSQLLGDLGSTGVASRLDDYVRR